MAEEEKEPEKKKKSVGVRIEDARAIVLGEIKTATGPYRG